MQGVSRVYLRDPTCRSFVRGVREQGIIPEHLNEHCGEGLYIGHKPGKQVS